MMALQRELDVARNVARDAGEILRRHYAQGSVQVHEKDDASPVTAADLESSAILVRSLCAAFPEDAVVSEEAFDDGARKSRSRVWFVDPLDGTRDFVERTGDFAVHVGLCVDGTPCLGVVYVPVADEMYWACTGQGAICRSALGDRALRVSSASALEDFRVAIGRTRVPPNVQRFLDARDANAQIRRVGASIKLMALARGDLELCLWLHAAEKAWDTCAPEVIVREAGGKMTDVDGNRLVYGDELKHLRGVVASNGHSHDAAAASVRPWFLP
jgi:3'(2'), 5'-bisphosphate nucleotidase